MGGFCSRGAKVEERDELYFGQSRGDGVLCGDNKMWKNDYDEVRWNSSGKSAANKCFSFHPVNCSTPEGLCLLSMPDASCLIDKKKNDKDGMFLLDASTVGGRCTSITSDEDQISVLRKKNAKSTGLLENIQNGCDHVSDKSSLFGRASTYGLDKAVEVLDTLGSSMAHLTPSSGFFPGAGSRGNKVAILAFEVANTIAKGANLMQSLSEENIDFMRTEILPSEGVQQLVSTDMKELLTIAAADKSEEFHVFSVEVVRFGDLCKDPEWHNLGRYFEKLGSYATPDENLREEADITIQHLTSLAQHTSELYHEMHALDSLLQDCNRKIQEEESIPASRRGEGAIILYNELKQQKKVVKSLQKKSLWSRSFEEVVEKLVEIVVFLHKKISRTFGLNGADFIVARPIQNPQRLGVSGLALHYANVINQINNIVSRPMSLPPHTRDTLYRGLPLGVKTALRSRLQSFHVKEELTVSLIKAEMQKILQWIYPMAENTIKAHQGFGWVGEWANMSSEVNRNPGPQNTMFRIQTLHHAGKERTEEYILQLAVWLHHLIEQVKINGYGFKSSKPATFPPRKSLLLSPQAGHFGTGKVAILQLSREERLMLEGVANRGLVLVRSKSQSLHNQREIRNQKNLSLNRSVSSSSARQFTQKMDFQLGRRNTVDVIDGMHTLDPSALPSSSCA